MKCENCGASLTLEDVVCPHCEALNEHAVQHIREMNRYKSEFEDAREEVYSVTQNYAGLTSRIIVIAVLIVLIVVCGILSGEAYSIQRNLVKKEVERKQEETKATMDYYLETRDYYAMAAFATEKHVDGYDGNFEEYGNLIYATKQYSYLYDYVMRTLNPYEGQNLQDTVKRIAEQLAAFYKLFDEKDMRYIGKEGEAYEHVKRMEEQIQALIMAYCNLTKEEAELLGTMTNAERTLLLEERIINEK